MKNPVICFCLVLLAESCFAAPTISNVTLGQDGARRVHVSYSLSEPAIVAAEFFADGESVGDEPLRTGLSGDVFRPVRDGVRSFTWNVRKAWPGRKVKAFSVRLTPIALASAPTWMDIDLENGGTRYYERESQLVGGSALDETYKTTHILLKRIRAAGVPWRMGGCPSLRNQGGRWGNPHLVTLTEDFYCAVYELTQAQAGRFYPLAGQKWTGDFLPAHRLSYEALRGASDVANWPEHGHSVAEGSLLHILRRRCGQQIDLLTEAQWHFAAGVAADPRRFPGGGWGNDDGMAVADACAWTAENSGGRLHEVGLKLANPFGLYDMNGNGGEYVLDWCQTVMSPASVVDPTGPSSISVSDGEADIPTHDGMATETVGRGYCGGCAQTAWNYAAATYRNWWKSSGESVYSAVRIGAPGTPRAVE